MVPRLRVLLHRIKEHSFLCFLLAAALFLYLRTFIFPGVPIYQGDNAPVFLLDARRMLEGQVLYRDFFELVFPGMPLSYSWLFRCFGVRAWIPAALLVAIGTALAGLGVAISRRLVRGGLAYLPSGLFVALAFGNALDATHHWISILAVMAALALAIAERSPARLFAAGMLCGVATVFTQSRGVLAVAAFAVYLLWERREKERDWAWFFRCEGALFAGATLAALPPVLYFAWKAGFSSFVYCTFTFVARYYSSFGRNNLGVYMVDIPEVQGLLLIPALAIWLLIHLLVPLTYLVLIARYARRRRDDDSTPWDRLMLVNGVGLAFFLAILPAPNWFKVASATLPALILLAWFLEGSAPLLRLARAVFWLAVGGMAVAGPILTQLDGGYALVTPVGRVAVLSPDRYDVYRWFLRHTSPGQAALEAGDTDIYFVCGLENPAPAAFLTPTNYTRPWQVRRALEALRGGVRLVLWSPWLDLPEPDRGAEDHLRELRAYLREDYRVVKTFKGGEQVWEKKPGSRLAAIHIR